MIDSVNYTVNGEKNILNNTGDGTYSEVFSAPSQEGNYLTSVEVIDMAGNKVLIDSTDERFNMVLNVDEEIALTVNLLEYLPEFLREIREFKVILNAESIKFSQLMHHMNKNLDNNFIDTMTIEAVERFEKFLGIIGEGTLEQRKNYIKALIRKKRKLNEESISTIIKTITGSKAIIKFYTGDESGNPYPGQGTLSVKVLTPDLSMNYKFDDVAWLIVPLMPAHIKLELIRYFATWKDIKDTYPSWESIKTGVESWDILYNFIPPVVRL